MMNNNNNTNDKTRNFNNNNNDGIRQRRKSSQEELISLEDAIVTTATSTGRTTTTTTNFDLTAITETNATTNSIRKSVLSNIVDESDNDNDDCIFATVLQSQSPLLIGTSHNKLYESEEIIPYILRPIVYLYRSVPNILYIPVPLVVDIHEQRKQQQQSQQQVSSSTNKKKWRKSYITFSVVSMIMFICIDTIIGILLKTYITSFNRESDASTSGSIVSSSFDDKEIRMIAGSLTTVIHSCILVPFVALCLYYNTGSTKLKLSKSTTNQYQIIIAFQSFIPSLPIYEHNELYIQDCINCVLEFCIGYMFYDVIIQFGIDRIVYNNSTWYSTDLIFIGHHAATSLYMGSCRWIQVGHISALSLMLFGEITAPIMNILRISFTIREQYEKYNKILLLVPAVIDTTTTTTTSFYTQTQWLTIILHPYLQYIYALLYFPIRAIIGPILILYITYDLLFTQHGRYNVPIYISCIWLSLSWAVALGSYSWIINCYNIILTGTGTPIE